jgi:hypothetical protein
MQFILLSYLGIIRLNVIVKASLILGIFMSVMFASSAQAEQRSDCTNIAIDYTDNSALTVQEQANAMEKAFYDSLNKYDSCLTEEQNNASDDASRGGSQGSIKGGGGATGTISGTGAGSASGEVQPESAGAVASTGISGVAPAPSEQMEREGSVRGEQNTTDPVKKTQTDNNASVVLNNGKTPDDIPASNNDSLLEAKIREAAENETDPETKAKLWNEYRKYKGLPLK